MQDRNNSDVSRRRFLARSAAGLALAGLPEWFAAREARAAEEQRLAPATRRIGPNDQINIGGIGMGGSKGGFRQGLHDTRAVGGKNGCKVVAVCDVDRTHREEAGKEFQLDAASQYLNYRELLARPDIDAVVIGTPDHWHAVMAVDAMRAGKDVYCEKPLTHNIDEGKTLVRVARETGRVFQVGSQQRSDARFRLACELVRNGRIGTIKRVEARLPGGSAGGPFPVLPYPSDLDWNRWLGPAPYTEYVKERTHGSWRHWYEYAGGMVADWGAHHFDIAQWGLGTDRSGPVRIESKGEFPPQAKEKNAYDTPTQFEITFTYANGIPLIGTNKGENGVRFEGDRGWIFVSRGKIEASDQKLLDEPLPKDAVRLYVSNDHAGNFVECVRARKTPICDAEIGHRSATLCHLGNISLRLGGRRLEWDPKAEMITNDREAVALMGRIARRPWSL